VSEPTRVLVVGAMGRMGERVRAALEAHPTLQLAAALERPSHAQLGDELAPGIRLGDDVQAALEQAEVAIVFASPDGTLELLRRARKTGVACVVGTTGLSAAQQEEAREIAEGLPLVLAGNFSVAVNVLFHLTREASRLLGVDYDAEIVELHHAAKVDAPSGTALRLGRAVAEGRGEDFEKRAVRAREGHTGPRPAHAIGLQALRGGDNTGEHSVLLLGRGERLELTHRSSTRDHFAEGAVRAAEWVLGREPGLYEMEHVLGLGLGSAD
jgi:4-hydroxy-tetrahydrodipicolinate reductase